MIKKITVTNHLGEYKEFELARPDKSGFIVEKVDGLGPVKANILTTEVATTDGSQYNSARATSRNIVLRLRFLMNPTVEDVRQETYKYFPLKQRVKLTIETDNRISEVYGYVESNEPQIFEENEYATISLICPDSYLQSITEKLIPLSNITPLFEFPFSNESLNEKLIIISSLESKTRTTITYNGDSEVGMQISIHILGLVKMITMYLINKRQEMKIDTDKLRDIIGRDLQEGDEIIINTNKGYKNIQLFANGEYTNILNCLDKHTNWFQLSKGNNEFSYVAEEGESLMNFVISFRNIYEGV